MGGLQQGGNRRR